MPDFQLDELFDIMVQATATALVGAGLISVVAFPAIGFAILGDERRWGQPELGEEAGFAPESTRL